MVRFQDRDCTRTWSLGCTGHTQRFSPIYTFCPPGGEISKLNQNQRFLLSVRPLCSLAPGLLCKGQSEDKGKTPRYECGSKGTGAATTTQNCDAPTQNSALKDLCFGSVTIEGNFPTWQLLLKTTGKKGTASCSPCRIVSVPCNVHRKTEGHPDCHILRGERCPGKNLPQAFSLGKRRQGLWRTQRRNAAQMGTSQVTNIPSGAAQPQ